MNDIIINWFNENADGNRVFYVPEEIYAGIDSETADILASTYGKNHLVTLPQSEIFFFEWLKSADKTVWDDLWTNQMDEPYLVGMSFLPLLIDKNIGFPICDLETSDNYFFSPQHIVDNESTYLLDSIKTRFMNKESITPAHLLLLKISYGPLDIWHFAYNSKISLNDSKRAVEILVEDGVLVHLTDTDHLSIFVP